VFEFARQLATAKQPSDMIELWTAHAEKQFDLLTEQTKELSALGQKIAGESVEPITRGVNQAFKKASWAPFAEPTRRTIRCLALQNE
jgi:hypothetical protein